MCIHGIRGFWLRIFSFRKPIVLHFQYNWNSRIVRVLSTLTGCKSLLFEPAECGFLDRFVRSRILGTVLLVWPDGRLTSCTVRRGKGSESGFVVFCWFRCFAHKRCSRWWIIVILDVENDWTAVREGRHTGHSKNWLIGSSLLVGTGNWLIGENGMIRRLCVSEIWSFILLCLLNTLSKLAARDGLVESEIIRSAVQCAVHRNGAAPSLATHLSINGHVLLSHLRDNSSNNENPQVYEQFMSDSTMGVTWEESNCIEKGPT